MKRRVTLLTPPEEDLPQNAVNLSKNKLELKGFPAVREERFTFALNELPTFVKSILAEVHELYIRFDNGKDYNYKWKGPYVSRLPVGLHVFAVPLPGSRMDKLCNAISVYGRVKCRSVKDSFISYKKSKMFYIPDEKLLDYILRPLANKLCAEVKDIQACREAIWSLSGTSMDIKYDVISQILEVNALWGTIFIGNTRSKTWDLTIQPSSTDDRIEVGILSEGKRAGPEDISVEGIVAVVGEDDKFKNTAFSFPSRHHDNDLMFKGQFFEPTGLHPKFEIEVAPIPISPGEACTLNAYYTIPQPFFVDPYQLQDSKFLASNGIKSIRVIEGETDLELPTWAVSKWGAIVLAELDVYAYFSGRQDHDISFVLTLPLHLRYMPTDPKKTNQTANFPWPSLFWACKAEMWKKMDNNPFDRKWLGYEQYFPEQTLFFHLTPALIDTPGSYSTLEVPVLSSESSSAIYWGTIAVISVGFLWVFGKVVTSLMGLGAKKVDEQKKKE